MIRSILTFLIAATTLSAAVDSVQMGAGYANQVWYQPNTLSTTSPQASWHLGFQSGMSATIIANDALAQTVGGEPKPFKIFVVPNSTPSTYAVVDTAGMSTWTRLYNQTASWTGALNTVADPSNMFDYGWGTYNTTSHSLKGERVYVLVMPDGTMWKLFIESWTGYSYKFKYAHIDGSEAHTGEVDLNGIVNKSFIYWSFTEHASIDREPPADRWDLTFLRYIEKVALGPGEPVPYPVVGVLARPGIKLAKVIGPDPSSLQAPSIAAFDSASNVIGYDWKAFAGGKFTVADSTAYFILRRDGSMWKMVMTGFTGSSTGTTTFNADVVITSVADAATPNSNVLGVHPNVVGSSDAINVVVDASTHIQSVSIVDITGRTIRSIASNLDAGMYAIPVLTSGMAGGHYTVVVQTATHTITSALIVQ